MLCNLLFSVGKNILENASLVNFAGSELTLPTEMRPVTLYTFPVSLRSDIFEDS
jgi:hypothetical protein